MGLLEHIRSEFEIAWPELIGVEDEGLTPQDLSQKLVMVDIANVANIIEKGGYAGQSMEYFWEMLTRLLSLQPLAPLTGEDDEWGELIEQPNGVKVRQNKRSISVFKHENGRVYDTRANKGRGGFVKGFPYLPS